MNTIEILARERVLLFAFILVLLCGFLTGEIIYRLKKEKALKLGEKLDGSRDVHIRIIYNNITKSYGVLRVIIVIFAMNLLGGALIWSSIGGILIVIPFLHYALIGFLTNLVLKRYPERMKWITIPNILFEVAAFMVAAVGGIGIGLSIWGAGNVYVAFKEWSILFITIVVPFQLIAAIFEGFLFKRIYIIEKHPWPREISKENNL